MPFSIRGLLFVALVASLFTTVAGQSILIDSYTERGKMAFEGGDLVMAEQLFKAALSEAERSVEPEQIATCSVNLGKVHQARGAFDLAERLYLKALEVFEKLDGKDTERALYAMNNLGLLYAEKKEFTKAEEYLRRTLTIRQKLFGKNDPDVAVTMLNLGKLYADQKKFVEADAVYLRSFEILIQHPEDMLEETLVCLHNLSLSTQEINNPKRAESVFKMWIAIIEKNFGKSSLRLSEPLTGYVTFLKTKKRSAEAKLLERRLKLLK
ncbi:MAG: tetratricopeptide repeat protein [Pyrinomonadaceae bacterium]